MKIIDINILNTQVLQAFLSTIKNTLLAQATRGKSWSFGRDRESLWGSDFSKDLLTFDLFVLAVFLQNCLIY